MNHRILLGGLVAVVLSSAAAAAAQGPDQQWAVTCKQTEAGRQCDLSVPVAFHARKGIEYPVMAIWSVVNRPMAIEEALEVRIDGQALPGYRLLGVADKERRTMVPPELPAGDVPAAAVREALMDGHDLSVVLIDDATGRQSAARLPSAGFEGARAAMFAEIAKGANRD